MTQSANSPLPDGKAMLEHVVTVVLKQAKDGLLAKALDAAAVHEINDVLLLNQPARDALTFPLDDGTEKKLPIGYMNLLRALKIFADHYQANRHPIGVGPSSQRRTSMISGAARCAWQPLRRLRLCLLPPPTPASAVPPPKQKDLLAEFKKGIKRDASLFVVLKNPKQWDSWHCSTVAQAS